MVLVSVGRPMLYWSQVKETLKYGSVLCDGTVSLSPQGSGVDILEMEIQQKKKVI